VHRLAAVALVLATPVATWFLVGDLSATRFDDLDYLWRAPDLPAAMDLVVGVLAALVVVASATVLAVALRRGQVRRQWSATVVLLCAAGAVLGYAGRVVSAGVIGANIGGGMMIVLAGPLVLALVVAAAWNAWYESRRR
jgi:hypothetical protein